MESWTTDTFSCYFILLAHLQLVACRIHKLFARCLRSSWSDRFFFSVDGCSRNYQQQQPAPKEITTTPVSPPTIAKLDDINSARRSDEEFLVSTEKEEDVRMILGFLGIAPEPPAEVVGKKKEKKGGAFSDDDDLITSTFEDEEPSLGEVKEAFDVFDSNRDGFIEPEDLRRVLTSLGLLQEAGVPSLASCREMISVYDADRDGKIDFHDFVKVMEGCFS